jgi:uncharacterized repeat protein (TIGR01451 family)/CSLREA domain-containing protein
MRRPSSPARRVGRSGRLTTRRPLAEILEDRRLLAVLTVNTAADEDDQTDTTLSLREAIEVSNGDLAVSALSTQEQAQVSGALSSPNTIDFAIPGMGVQVIRPTTNLPTITAPVIIDGYSQPGASANTNPITQADNAVLRIQIDGAADIGSSQGFGLTLGAGDSTVRGLVVSNFSMHGIVLAGSGGNRIAGNFIGTDASGTVAMPNASFGLLVSGSDNTIGGTAAADRNVISGNGNGGAYLTFTNQNIPTATRTRFQGNFIGTDATGTKSLGSQLAGVNIGAATDTTIGGTTLPERNVISGNVQYGIIVANVRALIQGNLIGTDITGTVAVPNSTGITATSAQDTTIGGTVPGAGNIISGNRGFGLDLGDSSGNLVQGNIIGSDATGTIDLGNGGSAIRLARATASMIGGTTAGAGNIIAFAKGGEGVFYGTTGVPLIHNSFYGNQGPGITFSPGLVPTLTSATPTTIAGTLTGGTAGGTYHLEFFATPDTGHLSDNAQGRIFLGEKDVPADGSGNASFSINPTGGVPAGQFLTATATDPSGTTSAFSAAIKSSEATAPDLQVQMFPSSNTVTIGQDVTFNITIINAGTATATGLTLTDTLPTNATFVSATGGVTPANGVLTFANLGSLAVGDSIPLTVVVHTTATGTVLNTATVTEAETDSHPDNNTNGSGTKVLGPPLDGTLTGTAPGAVGVGQDVTYTLTATYTGSDFDVSGTLTDTLPTNATFVSATGGVTPVNGVLTFNLGNSLNAGDTSAFAVVVHPTAAGTLINQSQAVFSDDSGSVQRPLTQTTQVTTAAPSADLALAGTAPASVNLGQQVTFSLTVTTAGPFDATNVVLTDTLPAGTTFVSASASKGTFTQSGGVVTFSLGGLSTEIPPATVTIVVAPTVAGTIVNKASVTADQADPTPADNGLNQVVNVVAPTAQTANLVLTQVAAPQPVTVGDNLTYTLTVTDTGPNDDTGVVLTDPLPAGVTIVSETASQGRVALSGNTVTANLGSLAVNAKATVTIIVRPTAAGTLTNTAGVTADLASPNGTNTATQVTTVNPVVPPPVVTDGPRVVLLKRLGFHNLPTTLVLTFDRPLDPSSAQDPNNYVINVPGRGIIPVASAVYDPAALSVTLHPKTLINIHYAFFVTAVGTGPNGVRDTSGNLLDGAATGQPGSDYTARIVWFGPGTPISKGLTPVTPAHRSVHPSAASGLKLHRLVTARKARL